MRVTTRWLSKIRAVATGRGCVFLGAPIPPHDYALRSQQAKSWTQPRATRTASNCFRQYYTGRTPQGQPPKVVHDRGGERFYMDFKELGKAYLRYEMDGRTIRLQHMYVPEELRGNDIAVQLADTAFAYIKENNLKPVAECTYIQKYMSKRNLH